jgi:hypothetical protein
MRASIIEKRLDDVEKRMERVGWVYRGSIGPMALPMAYASPIPFLPPLVPYTYIYVCTKYRSVFLASL